MFWPFHFFRPSPETCSHYMTNIQLTNNKYFLYLCSNCSILFVASDCKHNGDNPSKKICVGPHYLINGTILGKETVIENKMCFAFLYNVRLDISNYKKTPERYYNK